ncbi:phosphodiester glycosidase family protein [Pedobacter hiemivivus]|uniref:Phosphodiester glycosidase family protein n=2 Tax=Pedobacter hiemivivus TaxID=2530454 RepID=A0A4U1GHE8_9SPHI|nr:phosphodiester glycosidase family protein [Pedobacter hiemivivus]
MLMFFFLVSTACKKEQSQQTDPRTFSLLTQKIIANSDVMANVFSDTTFQLQPGIEETDIHYLSQSGGLSTRIFILKLDLKNPDVKLQAATPYDAPGSASQTVPDMAKYIDAANNRVLAGINGDFFNTSSYVPLGIVYKKGVAVKSAFTDNTDKPQQGLSFLGILANGKPYIGDKDTDYPAIKNQLKEALGAGVFLVRDHKKVTQTIPTVDPRTGVGITDDDVVYFIVVDGRSFYHSNGINYQEMGKIMYAFGVKDAVNLDGGGSSTFMIKHPRADIWQVRNQPADGAPRALANSWLIVSKTKP